MLPYTFKFPSQPFDTNLESIANNNLHVTLQQIYPR